MQAPHECEATIRQEIARHAKQFGNASADLEQEAYLAAVIAIKSHQPHKYPLSKWVRLSVRSRLIDIQRKHGPRSFQLPEFMDIAEPEQFDVDSFLSDLSDDAWTVIDIILDPDPNFWKPPIVPCYRKRWLSILRDRLRKQNWSASRIGDAFSCIREALA